MAKICVIGNTERGKSEWVMSVLYGMRFGTISGDCPTLGVNVVSVALPPSPAPEVALGSTRTEPGVYSIVKLWDCSGYETFSSSVYDRHKEYYRNADAAIIVANDRAEADKWTQLFLKVAPSAPIVVCNRASGDDGDGMIGWIDFRIKADPLRPLRILGYI